MEKFAPEGIERYARKDTVTGKGMNEGYIFEHLDFYCAAKIDAQRKCKELGYKNMKEAYKDEAYYWTEWEVDEDDSYFDEEGNEYNN